MCTVCTGNWGHVHFCALKQELGHDNGGGFGTPGKFEVKLKALWWKSKGKEAIVVLCAVGGMYNRSCI